MQFVPVNGTLSAMTPSLPTRATRRPLSAPLRWLGWLLLLVLTGCAFSRSRPDLDRLYADLTEDPNQPPIILIHGLMGSTLVDAATGRQYWPGSLGAMAFSDYRDLIRPGVVATDQPQLVPGELFAEKAGVDFYASLIDTLERVGHFKRGTPGSPVVGDGRRYYVMLYDWRRDNLIAVRQLHALIEQIRQDYGNPGLRVDIVAHSNGGLIANYYLRYGPADVLERGDFPLWSEGSTRVRKLVRMGTPQLGSVTSLDRLIHGMRVGLRTVPVEVLASFATPYQALPAAALEPVLDRRGQPVALDLFDPLVWKSNRWSVYDPELIARVATVSGENGQRVAMKLQATFEKYLRRAARLQAALAQPLPDADLEVANFGGDCTPTQSHAVLLNVGGRDQLVFRAADIADKLPDIDYPALLFEPGDGLVTRRSQIGPGIVGTAAQPRPQNIFLCEEHGHLTSNPYFRNNLLLFLLGR